MPEVKCSSYRTAFLVLSCWTISSFPSAAGTNATGEAEDGEVVAVQFEAPGAIAPVAPRDRQSADKGEVRLAKDLRIKDLFGSVDDLKGLSGERRKRVHSPAADAVLGGQATGRQTADAGNLLKQALSTHGVANQNRSPLVSETRVRGQRVGQVLASGSYWAPARMDLDTMLNKLDSRLIQDMILVKGPYSPRYGPGFRFVDLEFIHSPRFANGFEAHGSTSGFFETNGDQVYGRQSIWAGDEDSGLFASYGHRRGYDYETGQDGFFLPTNYKSRDLFLAYGKDLSPYESVEFNLLRLDQTDIEFPGLVFDLDFLVTDGYEVTYNNSNPSFADHFTAELWYNRTRFAGNNFRDSKAIQQPFLIGDIGLAVTDGDALSGGHRLESTYNLHSGNQFSVGTDMIILNQELNDIESFDQVTADNFPIPRSSSVDVGYYAESVQYWGPYTTVTAGLRSDVVITNARDFVPGVGSLISDNLESELQQKFFLGATYMTAEVQLSREVVATFGAGYSERQPTLTELYADGPFIGSLQRGRTFLVGDPQLDEEKLIQLDYGMRGDFGAFKGGMHGYYSWIHDYITYDLFAPSGAGPGDTFGFPQGAALVNTDLATLAGAELYGQYQFSRCGSFFGTFSYVEGIDRTRRGASRIFGGLNGDRSGEPLPEEEPLPGIYPLETRLGFLFHDPSPSDVWGVELSARIVDDQSLVATTLEEVKTPGFTTYDIRTYVREGNWLLTSGFKNLTNKFYREHIDYRSGRGVFRPGFSFYTGLERTY